MTICTHVYDDKIVLDSVNNYRQLIVHEKHQYLTISDGIYLQIIKRRCPVMDNENSNSYQKLFTQ